MLRTASISALTICGAFALSGCQLFDNSHLQASSHRHQDSRASNPAAQSLAIDEGRRHLRGNRYGMAIDAFNRGLAQGEDPAAAYNGLGVAYARIGRSDLAHRFFKKAVMSDPANPIYSRNLATLIVSPEYQLAMTARAARQTANAAVANQGAPRAAAARSEGVQLLRESNRQFSLVTVLPQAAPARAHPGTALALCDTKSQAVSCQSSALAKTASRNRASGKAAPASAGSPLAAGLTPLTGAPDEVAQAPAGKRKVVDFSGTSLPARPSEAKPKEAAPPNETT